MRILVIEDDSFTAQLVLRILREAAYAVDLAADVETARYYVAEASYDLLILDRGLPGVDGLELCREFRSHGLRAPILILTGRGSDEDIVDGLDAGADDYISKPFARGVLVARVRALLRRSGAFVAPSLEIDDLRLDTVSRSAERAGRTIDLTAKEYALLEFFMRNPGRIISKTEIAEHVWDDQYNPFANLIEVYVVRLRKKIDDGAARPLIHTRRGHGYIFDAAPRADESSDTRSGTR